MIQRRHHPSHSSPNVISQFSASYLIPMPSIDDSKCVLVTGATAGIGRALALGISQLPSHPKVIATGRRQDRLQELAKSGLGTIEINFDTNKETLKVFVADLLAKHPDVCTSILTPWSAFLMLTHS